MELHAPSGRFVTAVGQRQHVTVTMRPFVNIYGVNIPYPEHSETADKVGPSREVR